ncbi:MAG TPA: DUF3223 domain-containing protein [Terrimesophilobacter sp.]|nr:DUF3223 domain-containing protein [Terrimesophilobacter sp.]HRP99979.1 DUF3223 domain-containing protein [Terrimesophilobacter sp.]
MPRSHPVELGARTFPNKSAAKSYVRAEILHAYEIGEPIRDPEHLDILMDILDRKDNGAEKRGGGIDYFFVDFTRNYRVYVRPDARTLAIRHTSPNEVDVDFGYESAIADSSDIDFAKEALRYTIQDKRDEFKFSNFSGPELPSDADGELIERHEDSEVRYKDPTWGQLTANFAARVGGWEAIETHSGDGVSPQIGRRLISDGIAAQWRDYYDSHANPVLTRTRGT